MKRNMIIISHVCRFMLYSDWNGAEPGGGIKQNCLIMYIKSAWKWHDTECGGRFGYICEMTV